MEQVMKHCLKLYMQQQQQQQQFTQVTAQWIYEMISQSPTETSTDSVL